VSDDCSDWGGNEPRKGNARHLQHPEPAEQSLLFRCLVTNYFSIENLDSDELATAVQEFLKLPKGADT